LNNKLRPYSNVPWDETVYHLLLEGQVPLFPATFPDHEELAETAAPNEKLVEEWGQECLSK
jgi:hypothetical protein